jgi:hypothetical protein
MLKQIHKKYRLDLDLWETKTRFLFISFYKYSCFGKKTSYSLFLKDNKSKKYFIFVKSPFNTQEIQDFHLDKFYEKKR